MIDRFLRRVPVRSRIVSVFLVLVVLLALSVPLIVANQSFILRRLQQITDVEARADRLLLLGSARIESSRVNLMRYIQDYAPSAYEAMDDVDQATELLTEARDLILLPEQKEIVETVLAALEDYKGLVGDVEAARSTGEEQNVSQLLFQAYRLGNDIGQRIEQIVNDSEARVTAANEAVYAEAQTRLILLGSVYVVVVILALILGFLIQRSITRPIAELRSGAEAFRQGQLDVAIPVVGTDELSLLAQAFNEMVAQLRELIGVLEQRVADRTRDLERRAMQLSIAADVGRAAASILELESLTQEVVELVRGRFELYYVGLFLLDDEGRYAVLEAGTGKPGRVMKEQGHRLEVGGVSMVGAACARREARVALDVGDEPVRFDNPLLPETRSEMALPLMIGDRVLGALDVQSVRPTAFSEEDIAVLQLVADQVTVAIQNARLFTEVDAALEAERRAYGEISREGWEELLRTRPDLGFVRSERGFSRADNVWRSEMERAIRTGESSVGGDGGKGLAMPIVVRGDVIGVIDACKPGTAGGWTPEDMEMMETLTEQLGVVLEGARLYQDTQRRAAREQVIGEVTARMRETLDVETVLKTAVDGIAGALGLAALDLRLGLETGLADDGVPSLLEE